MDSIDSMVMVEQTGGVWDKGEEIFMGTLLNVNTHLLGQKKGEQWA